jgi:hypothetical protein
MITPLRIFIFFLYASKFFYTFISSFKMLKEFVTNEHGHVYSMHVPLCVVLILIFFIHLFTLLAIYGKFVRDLKLNVY